MQCNKCGTIGEGQFCSNCGAPLSQVPPVPKKAALLGFRSNQTWKKVVTIAYIILCLFMTFGSLLSITQIEGKITIYDHVLRSLVDLLYLLILYSPYIFLSDTKFRDKLPLFKKHIPGYSGIGIALVFIFLLSAASILDSYHSPEYLADMKNHAYAQIENVPATCEESGYILYHCDYCGKENKEVLTATDHNYVQAEEKTVSCIEDGYKLYRCEYCNAERKDIVPATGHNMIETAREEATEITNGKIIMTCTICGEEKVSIIDKLPTESETAVALTDKELYIAACQTLTYKELARQPEKYKGQKLYFKGKIMQVSESIFSSEVTYLIQVTQSDYGFWNDNIYVTYKLPNGAPKVLEDDIVMIYGECKGDYTYISVLGASITIPYIKAAYIDILELE